MYFHPEYHSSDNVSCVLQSCDYHLSYYTWGSPVQVLPARFLAMKFVFLPLVKVWCDSLRNVCINHRDKSGNSNFFPSFLLPLVCFGKWTPSHSFNEDTSFSSCFNQSRLALVSFYYTLMQQTYLHHFSSYFQKNL